MTFDPAALIPLGKAIARIGLPFLPSLLNDIVPFPFSLLTAGAVSSVMVALGIDPSAPDAPAKAAAKIEADPVAAKAALQPVEDHHAELAQQAQEAYLHDLQDARATEAEYAKSGSPVQWGAPVVSCIAVLGFVVAAGLTLTGHVGDSGVGQLVMGAMIAGYTTVLNFWMGSSKGSSDKSDTIAALAKGAPAKGSAH